jgi:DNA polymerase III subunit alpha
MADLSSYVLLLLEIINFAKNEAIPLGGGRGSAGASLILFLLGITRVDPVEWNFPFERFINDRKTALDSEKIRITVDNKIIDYLPNDKITLKNGIVKLAKELIEGDEIV